LVIDEVASMEERLAFSMRTERQNAVLFVLFALVALVIAAAGVYGVAAYAVAQRTKEIGIRVAIGAGRRDVLALVLSQILRPTMAGVALGLAGAYAVTRLVASMLYGVEPLDPVALASGVVVLVGTAVVAAYVPARRAARIDPLRALRYD
jgi:ABC-type antimicrobial peptide transport system permease subunit